MSMPSPPVELAIYVGGHSNEDPVAAYLEGGAAYADHLLAALPAGFDLGGKRVLDYGCGSGRIMRHMVERGTGAVFEGCDIHRPSVEWLAAHLAAPHAVFMGGEVPPLDRPDGRYRMIYATSVFTHLAASWSRWLLELHRLLDDDGLLMVTHIGPSFAETFGEDPWREDRIGMLTLAPGNPWEAGGPMVLHSQWWVRAHWGRCFEVLSFEPDGFGSAPGTPGSQGLIVLRKRPVVLAPEQLETLEPGEPREIEALQHALRRAHTESIELNIYLNAYVGAYKQEATRSAALSERLEATEADLHAKLRQAERPRNAARAVVRGVRARLRG
jgi:SAM-dependent methyltransferase